MITLECSSLYSIWCHIKFILFVDARLFTNTIFHHAFFNLALRLVFDILNKPNFRTDAVFLLQIQTMIVFSGRQNKFLDDYITFFG